MHSIDHATLRRRIPLWLFLATAVAVVATGSAFAANIVGTPRGEVITGTAKADRLYGRGGDDRLVGLAGNDYLAGGAGSDRISCGPGRDRVLADARDKVAKDCEFVVTVAPPPPAASPPETSPPPPTTAPPPPAPPVQLARTGFFGGFASTGGSVNFVVGADGRSFSEFKFSYQAECQPPGRLSAGVTYSGTVPIAADRTFSADGTTSTGTTVKFSGSFDPAGTSASGRFQVHVTHDQDGTHYDCDSGGADWSAKWQG
jgi:Ca2+-binding RTX toxin-like protein